MNQAAGIPWQTVRRKIDKLEKPGEWLETTRNNFAYLKRLTRISQKRQYRNAC